MKKQLTNIEEYKSVKEETKNKFSELIFDKEVVPESLQKKELMKLSESLRAENFYFVVEVKEMKIIHADGMEAIGFNSKTFEMAQYAKLLPSQGVLQLLSLFWYKIFEFCEIERETLKFLAPKYIVQIPMKNAKSEIMLVKRTISPFQFTESRKLTQYLSEFTIVNYHFNNEPPYPRFIDIPNNLNEKLMKFIKNSFSFNQTPYSPKEQQILEIYSYDDGTKSTKELAEQAGITPSTLQFYNKQILANTREYLGNIYKFETAKQVASFIRNCGIIS